MRKVLISFALSVTCLSPVCLLAQAYELLPQFDNAYPELASRDGSRVLLNSPMPGEDGWFRESYSVFNGTSRQPLALPAVSLGKGWGRRIIAINKNGQILSQLSNFDIRTVHFEVIDATGVAKIVLSHEYDDLWSTQGIQAFLNDRGQAIFRTSEDGDYPNHPGSWQADTLYFFDGTNSQVLINNPKRDRPDQFADGVETVALGEDGTIAYSFRATSADPIEHFVRGVDGAVQKLSVPGLDPNSVVLDIAQGKVLLQSANGGMSYDLVTRKSTVLYTSVAPLLNAVTFGRTFTGERVALNSSIELESKSRKECDDYVPGTKGNSPAQFKLCSLKTYVNFIGMAQAGRGVEYLDCGSTLSTQFAATVIPQPDGKSFLVSDYGNPELGARTFLLRPTVAGSGNPTCRVYSTAEALLAAQKAAQSQTLKQSSKSKRKNRAAQRRKAMKKFLVPLKRK